MHRAPLDQFLDLLGNFSWSLSDILISILNSQPHQSHSAIQDLLQNINHILTTFINNQLFIESINLWACKASTNIYF